MASPRMHEHRTLSCNANANQRVKIPVQRKYSHTPDNNTNCLCVTVPVQNTCRAKVPQLDCGILCQENILFQDTEDISNKQSLESIYG